MQMCSCSVSEAGWDVTHVLWEPPEALEWVGWVEMLETPAAHPGEKRPRVPRARTLGDHILQTPEVPGGKLRPREERGPAPCHPAVRLV